MPNRIVSENHDYKAASITLQQVSALLIAVGKSCPDMDSYDVLAAISGIQELTINVSASLDKVGDVEVHHG